MRELGHFDAAREMINRVLAEGGRPPYALIMLGLIERAANNREAALEAFTAAHKTDRRYARALVEMAIEHRQLGQQAACDQCLILALECDSRHIQAISQLAEQALMADKAEQALQLYSKAISDQPECTEFLFGQVTALARLGRIQDALSVLRHIEETLGPSTLLRIRQISLLRRIGKYYDALNLAREATTKEPFAFWLWAERVETELFVGEDADVEACLAAMRPSTLRERANFERLKGRWAESQLQLTAAIGHYENAAAILTQDPTIQHLLARSRIMAMDLERVQHHLRRVQDLRAPILRLRGESPNTSQTELGHLLNEFTLDFELCNKLTKLQSLPAVQRAAELSALVRIAPDNTAPAINLLIALRQSGALTVMPTGEERVIPRTIMQFWDEAAIPEDIRGLMVSWHSQNPDHNHQIFDNANALAWIEAYYPKSVALAYWRSREAAQKSDIFRLAWLARQGGIYADTDDLCLRSLDTMLPSGAKLVLSHEVLGTVGNNFIAVVPRHPVIELALQLAVHAVNRGDNDGVWYSTGPALLTRALTQILTASGTLNMDGTAILSMRELFRSVAVGCAASYKITRRHWSKAAKVRKTYCLPANIQQYRLHAPGVHADNLTVEHGEAAVILGD
ncbi:glycosyltransferase [Acidocella aminolytica]|uniref:glycosyltransferase n=1 Tax=Acidocella aminolytica TaxID=33998 RepID=UPI00066239C2|nr:glycosyltransferase [Acidocella aminolytica]